MESRLTGMAVPVLAALVLVLILTTFAGCAARTETVTTKTTVVEDPLGPDRVVEERTVVVEGDPPHQRRVVTERTAVGSAPAHVDVDVDVEDEDYCHGVLSCTVNFVGDVIAFPFRLVAATLRALF